MSDEDSLDIDNNNDFERFKKCVNNLSYELDWDKAK